MNDKKIKIIIATVFAGLIIGVGAVGYFAFRGPVDGKANNTEGNVTVIKNSLPTNTKASISEKANNAAIVSTNGKTITQKEAKNIINSDVSIYTANKIILGTGANECPQKISINLHAKMKALSKNLSFKSMIQLINPYLNQYKFSIGINEEIATMYNDAELLLSCQTASPVEQGSIVKGMRNVEMKGVYMLLLSNTAREMNLIDQDSLNPIISGIPYLNGNENIDLNNYSNLPDYEQTIVKSVIQNCSELLKLNILTITVDKNYVLKTFVVTNRNATVQVYGYFATPSDPKYYFQTVAYWNKFNSQLKNSVVNGSTASVPSTTSTPAKK